MNWETSNIEHRMAEWEQTGREFLTADGPGFGRRMMERGGGTGEIRPLKLIRAHFPCSYGGVD
ncbi:MAG: hypothetical protein JWQ04_2860 [Pedosphaera sp.]|nr:hypothetical protein [Pedosphaera sp.]